jgi:hypothetical protein
MATVKDLMVEIKRASEEFNRLAKDYSKDRYISEKEFKELEKHHDLIVKLNTIIVVSIAVQKKDLAGMTKQLIHKAYENAKEQEKTLRVIFTQLEKSPSGRQLDDYNAQLTKFKFAVNEVEEINKTFTVQYLIFKYGYYVDDLEKRVKEIKAFDKKIELIKENLKVEREARKQTELDVDSAKQVDNIKDMLTKFNGLLNRMQTTQDNIITHFVGWQKASYGICIAHTKAEEKYKALMKAQDDETTKEAKLRSIALNVAIAIGNIIFPGLSTPVSSLITGVLSPVLDSKVTEYKDATIKVNKSVKNVKIGTTVDKAKAKEYVGHLTTIAANFDGITSTLKLGDSKTTVTSNFNPSNAAESLLKYNTEICSMIHEVANKVLTLENICQDIATRVENISTYKIFEDPNVDTSECLNSLKELYKDLSKAVNVLYKSKDKLSPPKLSAVLYKKPGDNDVFEQFVNVMLLKWLPSTEKIKSRIKVHHRSVGARRIVTRQKIWYKDYPTLIAKEVQNAITKYCGISSNHFKNIPYDTYTDWTTYDSTSDKAIAKLIKTAEGKYKSMENTNVWTSALGL